MGAGSSRGCILSLSNVVELTITGRCCCWFVALGVESAVTVAVVGFFFVYVLYLLARDVLDEFVDEGGWRGACEGFCCMVCAGCRWGIFDLHDRYLTRDDMDDEEQFSKLDRTDVDLLFDDDEHDDACGAASLLVSLGILLGFWEPSVVAVTLLIDVSPPPTRTVVRFWAALVSTFSVGVLLLADGLVVVVDVVFVPWSLTITVYGTARTTRSSLTVSVFWGFSKSTVT